MFQVSEWEGLFKGGRDFCKNPDAQMRSSRQGGSENLNISNENVYVGGGGNFFKIPDKQMRTSHQGGSENLNVMNEGMRKFI